jgi:hypothetical protein
MANLTERLSSKQVETIVNKTVELVAKPEDHAVLKFMLKEIGNNYQSNAASFTYFIQKILKEAYAK